MLNHYRRNFLFGQAVQHDRAAIFIQLAQGGAQMIFRADFKISVVEVFDKFYYAVKNFRIGGERARHYGKSLCVEIVRAESVKLFKGITAS